MTTMDISIRELKRRYTIGAAMHRIARTSDRGKPIPLSTGNPLFDAALTDTLVATDSLTEAEHVAYGWQRAREATDAETAVLAKHARLLLHDYKLLMALRCWERADEAGTREFVRAMPWGRRLAFPTAAIRPAAHMFTGWRRSIRFRLLDDPRFDALRELYRELLASAPPVAILKYRATIQRAAALLHYRFEGERERLIHDWCFEDGASLASVADMEPLATYVRARSALKASGAEGLARALDQSPANVALTSVMGLVGSAGVRLTDGGPVAAALRRYVVRCSSAIEALLRLSEWGPWLTTEDAAAIGRRVADAVSDDGTGLPIGRALQAYFAAPDKARKRTAEPMLLPVLQAFGRRVAALLPPPGPITTVQLGTIPHPTTLTVTAAIAATAPARLLSVATDSVDDAAIPALTEVAARLADGQGKFQQWIQQMYGDPTKRNVWNYDLSALNTALKGLDPESPLLLDVPAWREDRLMTTLMPFERVFNMHAPLGLPGEIAVQFGCYRATARRSGVRHAFAGYTDGSAARLAEAIEATASFRTLAAEADALQTGGSA